MTLLFSSTLTWKKLFFNIFITSFMQVRQLQKMEDKREPAPVPGLKCKTAPLLLPADQAKTPGKIRIYAAARALKKQVTPGASV